jgi:hypothetical protein
MVVGGNQAGKGAKGLLMGKGSDQGDQKDKKKPISRSSRAGLQVLSPLLLLLLHSFSYLFPSTMFLLYPHTRSQQDREGQKPHHRALNFQFYCSFLQNIFFSLTELILTPGCNRKQNHGPTGIMIHMADSLENTNGLLTDSFFLDHVKYSIVVNVIESSLSLWLQLRFSSSVLNKKQ